MRQSEAGFTLIELLVAMTAAGLLLAALSWSVSRLGRQLTPPDNRVPEDEVAAFEPVLQALIGAARPDDGETLRFSRNEVQFLTALPQAMGGTGDADVRLKITGGGGERFLEGVITPRGEGRQARDFRLNSRWESIQIEPLKGGAGDNAPSGVTLDFGAKGRTVSLVALTRVNTAADCVFDLISMACRPS